jgi:hypothetical protein
MGSAIMILTLKKQAANTCETPVKFYQNTRRSNTEDSHLYICRRENLKNSVFAICFED